jgi:hypothetical protein
MKKIIKLTESDLTRIVKRVIKESEYRAKFKDQKDNYWVDQDNKWVDFDPDLEKHGYYDFEYEPYTEVEDFEDIPEDIRNRIFGLDSTGKNMYKTYSGRQGKFQYSRKKDF